MYSKLLCVLCVSLCISCAESAHPMTMMNSGESCFVFHTWRSSDNLLEVEIHLEEMFVCVCII